MHKTDAGIALVRKRLLERRQELAKRAARIDADLSHRTDPLDRDRSERVVQLENDETLDAIDGVAREEISAIDAALRQIEVGAYGTCVRCHKAIEPARLATLPHAIACSACVGA